MEYLFQKTKLFFYYYGTTIPETIFYCYDMSILKTIFYCYKTLILEVKFIFYIMEHLIHKVSF